MPHKHIKYDEHRTLVLALRYMGFYTGGFFIFIFLLMAVKISTKWMCAYREMVWEEVYKIWNESVVGCKDYDSRSTIISGHRPI